MKLEKNRLALFQDCLNVIILSNSVIFSVSAYPFTCLALLYFVYVVIQL